MNLSGIMKTSWPSKARRNKDYFFLIKELLHTRQLFLFLPGSASSCASFFFNKIIRIHNVYLVVLF